MKRPALLPFFALAFVLSWTVWGPLLAAHYGLTAGATPVLHLLGSLGPALAAVVVSAWLGRPHLRTLLQNVVRWRVGPWPWLVAVLGPVLLLGAGLGIAALFGEGWPPLASLVRVAEYPELGPLAVLAAEVVFYGFG